MSLFVYLFTLHAYIKFSLFTHKLLFKSLKNVLYYYCISAVKTYNYAYLHIRAF